ncbi:MAG: hypothetical protein NVS3B20_21500 [Polyangiales bacterium]
MREWSSFSRWVMVVMGLAVIGCPKKEDAAKDDAEKVARRKRKKSAEDDGDGDKAAGRKKAESDDDAEGKPRTKRNGDDSDDDGSPKTRKPSKTGAFTAALEGTEIPMKFGKAYASFSGLHVTLSNEKTTCKYATPSDEAYQVEFDIPPGPGQKFYAGHPVGVSAMFNSQRIKLKQTWANPYQVTAEIEPFKLKEFEHVRGSLDFDVKFEETKADTSRKVHNYVGSGSFDVEICEDWNNFKKLPGLEADAGETDLGGTFAGEKFKYKTALANVWHDKANDLDYVESIEFYPTDDVTCTSRWDAWKKLNYFVVRSIGGASSKQKLTGTQQPADPSFSKPTAAPGGKGMMGATKWFGGAGGRHAWVQFDKLAFNGGAVLKGTAFAESGPDAKPDEQGKIGGRFEAKVCASVF